MLKDLFYLTTPVEYDGYFYAVAKTQEDSVGSSVLCRSQSLLGPFEKGPILGKGLRHCDIQIYQTQLLVFFTLIGDSPEKIVLGTIDTNISSDWLDWVLLPGPTLISAEHAYEHGNVDHEPSQSGSSKCDVKAQLRDPRFLPDMRTQGPNIVSGLLFYSVQGERALAVARISLNMTQYHQAVPYREQSNIDFRVFASSSLRARPQRKPRRSPLITGTGRSGTMYLCSFFRALGINISHDNDIDCGPYPGSDGAASWYDAFRSGREYDFVVHSVRHPLDVINSRAYRIQQKEDSIKYLKWMQAVVDRWEDTADIEGSFHER